ncbi:Motility protein A [uncultured bacterium]|nr:Motility protein A [uncultured bacterium]
MFPIIGVIIVFGSILGGYVMHHGNVHVLFQPAEFVILGGAALGAMVIMCPPKTLLKIIKSLKNLFGGGPGKKEYIELLSLMYMLFSKAKKEGLLGIESDVESPAKSQIFKKYPNVIKNHHAVEFICDNFRVYILGVRPFEFEEMMDRELEAHHEESSVPATVIGKVADSLPGFGIVAAVLGVVITMGKMSESPDVIGHSVAAALVGTFLGILLCYGFIGPIGNNLEQRAKEDAKYFEAIKVAILSFAKEMPPQLAVENARRVLFTDSKPSFKELETAVRKKAA